MSVIQLVQQYGYLAILLGTVAEGETVLLLGGFAAHQGYLSLPLVLAAALGGGVLGDQSLFHLGRRYGVTLLARFPRLRSKAQRVFNLIHRHRSVVIIGVRFLYGMRVIGPMAIGVSGVSPRRFLAYNVLGAAIWVSIFGGLGYLFGQILQRALPEFGYFEGAAFVALLGLGLAIKAMHHFLRTRGGPSRRHRPAG